MSLADFLRSDLQLYTRNHQTVRENTAANSDNREYALQALRVAFVDAVSGRFISEFAPIAASAGSVADRMTRLMAAQAQQAQVIRQVFPEEIDRKTVTVASVNQMKEALKMVFS